MLGLLVWYNEQFWTSFLWKSQVSARACGIQLNHDKLRGDVFLPAGVKGHVWTQVHSRASAYLLWIFLPSSLLPFSSVTLPSHLMPDPAGTTGASFHFYAETEHGRGKTAYSQHAAICKSAQFFRLFFSPRYWNSSRNLCFFFGTCACLN